MLTVIYMSTILTNNRSYLNQSSFCTMELPNLTRPICLISQIQDNSPQTVAHSHVKVKRFVLNYAVMHVNKVYVTTVP